MVVGVENDDGSVNSDSELKLFGDSGTGWRIMIVLARGDDMRMRKEGRNGRRADVHSGAGVFMMVDMRPRGDDRNTVVAA